MARSADSDGERPARRQRQFVEMKLLTTNKISTGVQNAKVGISLSTKIF